MTNKLENLRSLNKAIIKFGTRVLSRTPEETTVFSPQSLFTALAMTSLGAIGETLTEMLDTTSIIDLLEKGPNFWNAFKAQEKNLQSLLSSDVTFYNVNWLVLNEKIKLSLRFETCIKDLFNPEIKEADFEKSADQETTKINNDVARITNNLITNLIPNGTLTSDTILVLLNAIYFKASWENKFNTRLTKNQDFNKLNGSVTSKEMMTVPNIKEAKVEKVKFATIADLPYLNSNLVFRIIFPDDENSYLKTEVNLLDHLTHNIIRESNLTVTMPKFKIESSLDAATILKQMGMVQAFSDSADFSPMLSDDNLKSDIKVGNVIHKATFEVTEEGSEGSAATAVVMIQKCVSKPEPTVNLTLNRPFFFAIQDPNTKTTLFIGKYLG